ncbi:MAG: hypothetical protein JWP83_4546 [Mycobacterium sp.]|nr:hypothetical protein [Mycobacterium sp.]
MLVGDDQRGIRLLQNRFELAAAEPRVQPGGDRTDHRRGGVTRRVVDARRQPQRDHVSLTDAEVGELGSHATGPADPLRERDSRPRLDVRVDVPVSGGRRI